MEFMLSCFLYGYSIYYVDLLLIDSIHSVRLICDICLNFYQHSEPMWVVRYIRLPSLIKTCSVWLRNAIQLPLLMLFIATIFFPSNVRSVTGCQTIICTVDVTLLRHSFYLYTHTRTHTHTHTRTRTRTRTHIDKSICTVHGNVQVCESHWQQPLITINFCHSSYWNLLIITRYLFTVVS